MSTGLILFFIGASIFGVGIAVIFSIDGLSGKLFSGLVENDRKDKEIK
ncbi:MAG: hypothetical protein QM497_08410 [Sulfurimonas sp.]